MDQLGEIAIGSLTLELGKIVSTIILALIGVGLYWLLEHQIFPWYYGLETTSERNRDRLRRAIRFTLFGFFIVLVLRIFNIDYSLVDTIMVDVPITAEDIAAQKKYEMENPDAANDRTGVHFIVKISYLVQVLIAYIIANLLDLVLGEILTQRYFRRRDRVGQAVGLTGQDGGQVRWLRPVLMMLVAILFATETNLNRFILFPVPGTEPEIVITVGRVLNAAFVFLLINLVLTFLTSFVLKGYYQRTKVDQGSQFAIDRLLTYFVYILGVLFVIQAAGFNLVGIWTGAAALLVGIGIGLQQTFNDLICGVIILFERSVKVGDVVELSGHQVGTVRKVGARTSVIETRDDIIIFVPNSKLIGENVINWSQVERKARFHVMVGVAYGSDTQQVKSLLLEVANNHPKVLKSPPPVVRFLDFGDSSLNFDLIFWSRDFLRIEDTKSDLRFAIDAAFRAKNVEIPFPQRDLWIRGGLATGNLMPFGGANAGDSLKEE